MGMCNTAIPFGSLQREKNKERREPKASVSAIFVRNHDASDNDLLMWKFLHWAWSKLPRRVGVTFASDPNAVYSGLLWVKEKVVLILLAWRYNKHEKKNRNNVQVNYESVYLNLRPCRKPGTHKQTRCQSQPEPLPCAGSNWNFQKDAISLWKTYAPLHHVRSWAWASLIGSIAPQNRHLLLGDEGACYQIKI